MKNASEIMYKIGKIFNIIIIPISVILFVAGIVLIAAATGQAATAGSNTQAEAEAIAMASSGATLLAYGIILLIPNILSLIICTKKHNEIANGNNEVAPRVFLIVFGAIAENVFYILAGIFSLVARSQEQNQSQTNVEE